MDEQDQYRESLSVPEHPEVVPSLLHRDCNWIETLFRLLPSAVWMKDDKGCWQMANPSALELFGLGETSWQGKTDDELIALRPELASHQHGLLADDKVDWRHNQVITRYERVETLGEPPRLFEVRKRAFHCGEGLHGGVITVASKVEQFDGGMINAKVFAQIVEQIPIAMLITDSSGNIVYVNKAFEKISGYSIKEVLGKNPSLQKSSKTPKHVYRELWQAVTSGRPWQGELMNTHKDGSLYWEEICVSPVVAESGTITHFVAVKQDITLRKHKEKINEKKANFDKLTGLPNRFLVMDRLNQLLKSAHRSERKVAVLFLDFDDFKKVNDTLGHETGDRFLAESAKRIKGAVRSCDTVGRLGGDEFLILVGGLDDSIAAAHVARNILQQFSRPVIIDGRELLLTASIGIAVYPDDAHDPGELMRKADSAMYHAKEQGRNTHVYFTDKLEKKIVRRLMLEEYMRKSLQRDEFRLFFQPQIEIQTGKMIGVETLLRWENPLLGKVSPEEFIPVAESTGMIVSIGKWVLEEALRQMCAWRDKFKIPLKIAVNLSPRQFLAPDLISFVSERLRRYDVGPGELEFEVTEGVFIDREEYVASVFNQLKELGVRLAIDDFGTGYASLGYLIKYPFDILKLDKSFVSDLGRNPKSKTLLTGAIALAHGMGIAVVAEGVETHEQLEFLAKQRCEFAQGYLFRKPLPACKIDEILMEGLDIS